MINANLGAIPSQKVTAHASELELQRNRKQAAKVIAIEKEDEFDCEFYSKFYNLDSIFFCTMTYLNLIAMEDIWKHCMKQGVDIMREKRK